MYEYESVLMKCRYCNLEHFVPADRITKNQVGFVDIRCVEALLAENKSIKSEADRKLANTREYIQAMKENIEYCVSSLE